MRIADSVHRAHPWVIDRIAPDFELLDVWALPVEGERDELAAVIDVRSSLDPTASPSTVSRLLFWLRLRVGAWLGWDDVEEERPIPGCTETSLSARLPDDLRGSADGAPAIGEVGRRVAGGFQRLYRTETEAAAEISNATVHGVLHLSWVEQPGGRYRAHIAVYVKPRGARGRMYLKLIEPFRHIIVYPALMRQIRRAWEARGTPAPNIDADPTDARTTL